MMGATVTECANGGIVPSMATQPQTETAPPPAAARAGAPLARSEPSAAEREGAALARKEQREGAPLAGREQREGVPLTTRARREQRDPTPLASKEPETSPPAWRMVLDRIKGDLLPFGAATPEPWDYRPVPPFVLDEDGYLIEDARPMNDRHAKRMLAYGTVLQSHYSGRGGMVGVDITMPYMEGSPGKAVRPDLLVALAAEEREGRDSFKLWKEPVPDFVLEDLSPSTWRLDAVKKHRLYRRLGVREYWLFDETGIRLRDGSGARLREVLVGYRLRGKRYMRIRANAAGRLPSEVLGLELAARDGLLRFFDPATGEYLRIFEEWKRYATAERRGREVAELRATAAERRAVAERREKEIERKQKEAERREKEAAQARIAELEAKLRAQPGTD